MIGPTFFFGRRIFVALAVPLLLVAVTNDGVLGRTMSARAETPVSDGAPVPAEPTKLDVESELFIERPPPGERYEIVAQQGQKLIFLFDGQDAQVQVEGSDFLLRFEDGAQIVLRDLIDLASSENPPVLRVGGVDITADVILSQAMALDTAALWPSQDTRVLEHRALPRFRIEVHTRKPEDLEVLAEAESYHLSRAKARLDVARDRALYERAKTMFEAVRAIVSFDSGDLAEETPLEEGEFVGEWRFKAYSKFDRLREIARRKVQESERQYEDNFEPLPEIPEGPLINRSLDPIGDRDLLTRSLSPRMRPAALRALLRLETFRDQLPVYDDLIALHTEIRDAFRQQFDVMQRSLIDILSTEEELYRANVERIETEHEQALATVELLAATGQLTQRFDTLFVAELADQPPGKFFAKSSGMA